MSIIKASCVDQTLRLTNTPVIASGGVGEDFVEFSFCPLWDGYIKTGVFYNNRGVFYAHLDKDDTCVVPCQALEFPGNLFIAVFGYKDGVTRTSEVLQYQIAEGAITAVPDPDPDVYEQIMEEFADIRAEWEEKRSDIEGLQEDVSILQKDVVVLQKNVAVLQGDTEGEGSTAFGKVIFVTLSAASWVETDSIFTQGVWVEGGTGSTIVLLQPTPEQLIALDDDGVATLQVNNDDGIFTAAATGAAPSTDMTIQATIWEVFV